VRTVSQEVVICEPAGMSNSTVQLGRADEVPLVTVILPSNPLPQSDTLTKLALSPLAALDWAAGKKTIAEITEITVTAALTIRLVRIGIAPMV
jgi:hypothetical protein